MCLGQLNVVMPHALSKTILLLMDSSAHFGQFRAPEHIFTFTNGDRGGLQNSTRPQIPVLGARSTAGNTACQLLELMWLLVSQIMGHLAAGRLVLGEIGKTRY